ncbi:MAG: CAP domain-containing protein [Endozoicomonadaceae bacterium]|nr:CAP domain-containing protein [Endozoicomonadaceae bacterium]
MNKRHVLIVLLAGLIAAKAQLSSASPDDIAKLRLVHQARAHNGLLPFKHSVILEQAAENHNHYLVHHRVCSHFQNETGPVFSGYSIRERVHFAGYPARRSTENISCLNKNSHHSWEAAVSGLMGAIYHRQAFLDYETDEIGLSYRQGKESDALPHKFTFAMGSSYLNRLCQSRLATKSNKSALPPGRYYFFKGLCRNPETEVNREDYESTRYKLYKAAPDVIIYPWDGQKNVFPAFLDDELPDPTPTLALSGMPVSIQFNALLEKVSITDFTLREASGKPVEVWQLDATNDIHKKMSSHQYAWFPVKPLKRATAYHASVRYIANNQPQEKSWTFQTEPYHHKFVYSVSKQNNVVFLPEREQVTVQWEDSGDSIKSLSCWCVSCNSKIESFNTISLFAYTKNIKCTIADRAGNELTFFAKRA